MARLPFLRTHSRYREMADAFIDGELHGRDLAKFEAHSAACAECSAMLETGRLLKQTLGQVPLVEAPRSFRITPALLAEAAPKPAAPVRATPVLMVARFGAAASFAAFAVVGTLQFTSTAGTDGTTAASPMSELSTAGSVEDDSFRLGEETKGELAATPTEDPQPAPPPDSQVGGASADNPGEADPFEGPPTDLANDDGGRSTDPGHPYGDQAADGAVTTAFASPPAEATDYAPWLVVLGGTTILALGAVGTLEYRRRQV